MPQFSGIGTTSNFKAWVDLFERTAAACRVRDEERVSVLNVYLTGPAYQVFKQLPSESKRTFAGVKAALLARFCSPEQKRSRGER